MTHSFPSTITCDVIVVGAGTAGLAAAREIADAGLDVRVLEARDRLGGRLHTRHDLAGVPIEFGAEFLHTAANPLRPVLQKAGITERDGASKHEPSASFRAELGAFLTSTPFPEEDLSAEALLRDVSADPASGRLLTEAFDAQHGREELRRTSAADAFHELELEHADDEYMGEHNFRVPDGWDAVVDHLAAGLHCETRNRVEHIRLAGDEVVVEAASPDGQRMYRAAQVIVTAPLGVLKNGDIQFTPALPADKSAAIETMITLDIVKFVFIFDGDVWNLDSSIWRPELLPATWWHSTWDGAPNDETVIVGWAVGDQARQMLQWTPDEMISQARETLRTVLGDRAIEPRFATFHSWGADPYTRGSYSHVPPGAARDVRERLAEPTDGRLFWAGEATASFRPRTVGGAYSSGKRAAEEVLQARSALEVSR